MTSFRLPLVGVMGSGEQPHQARSVPLGRWLATLPVHLLTGGGAGVMAAVSRAFAEWPGRRGVVVGVLPGHPDGTGAPEGYPNPWVEVAIRTHLPGRGTHGSDPGSRNHINILSSRVVVALPGGAGTAAEVRLAVRYGTPVVAFVGSRKDIPGLPASVPSTADLEEVQRFVSRRI